MRIRSEAELFIAPEVVRFYEGLEPDGFDPQAASAFFSIKAVAQLLNDVSAEWLKPYGLTPTTFNILSYLRAADQRLLSLTTISRSLHTRPTTLTTLMRSLENEGFIVRRDHPTDGRTVTVFLTMKGVRIVDRASRDYHRRLSALMADIDSRDRATLLAVVLRLGSAALASRRRRSKHPWPVPRSARVT